MNEGTGTVRFGLILPNGNEVRDKFGAHDLDTLEGRQGLVNSLVATARNIGFPETEFLAHYRWTTRTEIIIDTGKLPITDRRALVDATGDSSVDESTGSSDGGAVCGGPMGSPS